MQQQKTKPVTVRKNQLTASDKDYIREKHKTTTVIKLSQHLGRATISIYRFMDEERLSVFSTKPGPDSHRTPPRIKRGYFDAGSLRELI